MSDMDVVVDATSATIKLNSLDPSVKTRVRTVVTRNTLRVWDAAIKKVGGEVLHVRTGNLRRSIQQSVSDVGDGTEGRVFSDASVDYARIHEYGGKVSIPEVRPVNAKALAFQYEGKLVFAKSAKAHDVTIPARPYMRPSLAEVAPTFLEEMKSALAEAAKA